MRRAELHHAQFDPLMNPVSSPVEEVVVLKEKLVIHMNHPKAALPTTEELLPEQPQVDVVIPSPSVSRPQLDQDVFKPAFSSTKPVSWDKTGQVTPIRVSEIDESLMFNESDEDLLAFEARPDKSIIDAQILSHPSSRRSSTFELDGDEFVDADFDLDAYITNNQSGGGLFD